MTRSHTEHRTIPSRTGPRRIRVERRTLPVIEDSYVIAGRRFTRQTSLQLSPLRTAREVSSIFREAQRGFARHEEEYA